MPTSEPKEPHRIDIAVGLAVRNRRRYLGMTQPELAKTLNVSFQQVQRYEAGTIRISASRLYEISQALNTPVCYFFIGLDDQTTRAFADEMNLKAGELMVSTEGIELADLFPRIEDPEVRRNVVDLVRALQSSRVHAV